jgi:molecular chaperone GrpE
MSDDTNDVEVDFEPEDELGSVGAVKIKLAKLKEELETIKKERAEYLDGWQRCKADMVNSRREAEEARVRASESGRDNFILALLPALDSFDMAMQGEAWQNVDKVWRIGVESIKTQIAQVLTEHGVTAFGLIGDTFDPSLHEPISEEEGGEAHTIAKIFRRGYKTKNRILRPAQVAIFS